MGPKKGQLPRNIGWRGVSRRPANKGQVHFGRFYPEKRKQGHDTHMASRPQGIYASTY